MNRTAFRTSHRRAATNDNLSGRTVGVIQSGRCRSLPQLKACQKGVTVYHACNKRDAGKLVVALSAAASEAAPTATPPEAPALQELTKDNYFATLQNAEDRLVVIDFYTTFCGPCKLIYPQLCEIAQEHAGQLEFYRMNCNRYNKDLGMALEVKVAPTFFLYKGLNKVASMTGADVDALRKLIAKHL